MEDVDAGGDEEEARGDGGGMEDDVSRSMFPDLTLVEF
jgi:hypothetical protein